MRASTCHKKCLMLIIFGDFYEELCKNELCRQENKTKFSYYVEILKQARRSRRASPNSKLLPVSRQRTCNENSLKSSDEKRNWKPWL